jgi:hypothetical protein
MRKRGGSGCPQVRRSSRAAPGRTPQFAAWATASRAGKLSADAITAMPARAARSKGHARLGCSGCMGFPFCGVSRGWGRDWPAAGSRPRRRSWGLDAQQLERLLLDQVDAASDDPLGAHCGLVAAGADRGDVVEALGDRLVAGPVGAADRRVGRGVVQQRQQVTLMLRDDRLAALPSESSTENTILMTSLNRAPSGRRDVYRPSAPSAPGRRCAGRMARTRWWAR